MRGRTIALLVASLVAGCHLVLDPSRYAERDAGGAPDGGPTPDAGPLCASAADCGPAGIARCGGDDRCAACGPFEARELVVPLGELTFGGSLALQAHDLSGDAATIAITATAPSGNGAAFVARVGLDPLALAAGSEGFTLPEETTWIDARASFVAMAPPSGATPPRLGALTYEGDWLLYVGALPPMGVAVASRYVMRASLSPTAYASPPLAAVGAETPSWVFLRDADGIVSLASVTPPDERVEVGPALDEPPARLIGGGGRWVATPVYVTETTEHLVMWNPTTGADATFDPGGTVGDVAWLGGQRYLAWIRRPDGTVALLDASCDDEGCSDDDPIRATDARGLGARVRVRPLSRGAVAIGTPGGYLDDRRPELRLRWLDERLDPFDAELGPGFSEDGVVIVPFGEPAPAGEAVSVHQATADVLESEDGVRIVVALHERRPSTGDDQIRVVLVDGCAP